MDTVTHFAAGALTPLIFPRAPKRAALVVFGVLAGEFPDIDVFFGHTPEALMDLHRGITHALAVQPLSALVLALPFYFLLRRKTPAEDRFGLKTMFIAALLALCMHLYLDCMTTFGTKIFLPFSEYRAALPSMFIIDFLLTLPLLGLLAAALTRKPEISPAGTPLVPPSARRMARAGLLWALLYPLCALGVNTAATAYYAPRLAPEPEQKLILLTEPFSPFVWKAVVEGEASFKVGTLFLTSPGKPPVFAEYPKADPALLKQLAAKEDTFYYFRSFAPLTVQESHPVKTGGEDGMEYSFSDVRYIISPESPARMFGREDTNFILQARTLLNGFFTEWRFLNRGGDRDKTPWEKG